MQISNAVKAANFIKHKAPNFHPKVAIVLGSGQGPLVEAIQHPIHIDFTELAGFPQRAVVGQQMQLILGMLNEVPVVCLQGRPHSYEQNTAAEIKTYVRTLKLLGCEIFLATNASGSLRPEVGPGELVIINDHINFQPSNPLTGPNDNEFGPRFPAMDNAYDEELRFQFHTHAKKLNIHLHEGVYISVLGPSYETAAEIRAFKILGADVIGMSTVPEIIVARHCGLRVAVIATITNLATGLTAESHDHDRVVEVAQRAATKLTQLISAFVSNLQNENIVKMAEFEKTY